MSNATITKTVFFEASPETVWSFLTEKDKMAKWFNPLDADLAEGEAYTMTGATESGESYKKCWGTVIRMERPSILVYSFTIPPMRGVMTTVTWMLEEIHGGTKLTLSHEGIENVANEAILDLLMGLDPGWDQHLAELRSVVA